VNLIPGRSGTAHENWLAERGEDFRAGVRIATLDPFQGYKNTIAWPAPRHNQHA
jgi:transposase family protein